jgi:hypothetical protein
MESVALRHHESLALELGHEPDHRFLGDVDGARKLSPFQDKRNPHGPAGHEFAAMAREKREKLKRPGAGISEGEIGDPLIHMRKALVQMRGRLLGELA